jgi:hypothetical protein
MEKAQMGCFVKDDDDDDDDDDDAVHYYLLCFPLWLLSYDALSI